MTAGARFLRLLEGSSEPSKNYWIRVRPQIVNVRRTSYEG